MTRPANTRLTPAVTREICQRAASKAFIAGSIDRLGSEYVIGLKAINCSTGDTLAVEQKTAAGKEKVLESLSEAASHLRGQLGESLATVQKYDASLELATTASSRSAQGLQPGREISQPVTSPRRPALPSAGHRTGSQFRHSLRGVGEDYISEGETGRADEYLAKAYQLRDHSASERN